VRSRAGGSAGHRVIAIATHSYGCEDVGGGGFAEATTAADFLQNASLQILICAVRVVICDEAGLQSNRQGENCCAWLKNTNMR